MWQKSHHKANNTQNEMVQKPGLSPTRVHRVKSELGTLGYDAEAGGSAVSRLDLGVLLGGTWI